MKPIAKLFSSYRKWIRGADARVGRPRPGYLPKMVNPESPAAGCWCLRGAVLSCYRDPSSQDKAFVKLAESIKALFPSRLSALGPTVLIEPSNRIVRFNDHHKTRFCDVLKVIRHAKV